MQRKRWLPVVAVPVLVLIAASCSSDSKTAASGSSSASAAAPTGPPIQIGVIYPDDNQIINEPQVPDTAEAAAKFFNDRGGFNGHPVTITSCNEHADPNQAAQCASQMVDKKVTAILGWSLFDSGIVP